MSGRGERGERHERGERGERLPEAPAEIEILRGGALTTVQDLGRPGWRACGVPAGGAADPWAARAANRLVGNPDGAALLELTLAGPALRFAAPAVVALVGDPFAARVEPEGRVLAGNETVRLAAGAVLDLGRARGGARAWLAVAGGIVVDHALGSRATDLAGGFGGCAGRALRAGDRLRVGPAPGPYVPRRLAAGLARELALPVLRILPGPDERLALAGGAARLAEAAFAVGSRSDRRGVRLAGRRLATTADPGMRSQGVLPGAVQLPPGGEPIVLGVDAPVTGGYPWLAQVIAADVGRLARLAPGATVSFEVVDLETAARTLTGRALALAEEIAQA